MTSNIFSRLLPSTNDERTPQRDHQQPSLASDHGDRIGTDIDEENLGARFQDQDLDKLLADTSESQFTAHSVAAPRRKSRNFAKNTPTPSSKRTTTRAVGAMSTDDEDDVPESLLLENKHEIRGKPLAVGGRVKTEGDGLPPPVPGPTSRNTHTLWDRTLAQQRLHTEERSNKALPRSYGALTYDPKERALWMWANVLDLDSFLHEVYDYFCGHGIYSILLARLLGLLQIAFVVGLCTFLTFCINWSALAKNDGNIPDSLKSISHDKCFRTRVHGMWLFLLWVFCVGWLYKLIAAVSEIPRLRQLQAFYQYLLDIPDRDIQTVSWQFVVGRLMALRDANLLTAQNIATRSQKQFTDQSKQRMDAHDIANRLMRRQNYLIALFNKDVLDLTVHIPFLGKKQFFSKTTEVMVNFCVLDLVFDNRNRINPKFLTDRQRAALVESLRNRFISIGYLSILGAPVAVVFFLVSYFLRYFTEFQKDPGQLVSREFTHLAEWKFREFNELLHLFESRRNMALPHADRYLQQFPKHKMDQLYDFVGFVSGSFAAILGAIAFFDSQLNLGFEIAGGRSVLWFLTVFTAIWAFARSNIATPDEPVMDPAMALSWVIEFTHYCPISWKGRLHSDEVRQEFTALYQPKTVIFFQEILSMVLTPYILITRLPNCSERIVDFFREFTIHVDGLGHVCSYALFDFKKGADNIARPKAGPGHDDSGLRDDYYTTKDAKLAASFMGFVENYVTNPGRSRRNARNTKSGPFYLPPTFSVYNFGTESQPRNSRPSPHLRSVQSNARANPLPTRSLSPMHSILLDPHHQPSMSVLRTSPMQNPQNRFRGSRYATNDHEFDEVPEEEISMQRMKTSKLAGEESNLGESWRTTRATPGVHDNNDYDEEDDDDQAPGVLGLLYQFQKRHVQAGGGLGG